jgi:hypothetical protein
MNIGNIRGLNIYRTIVSKSKDIKAVVSSNEQTLVLDSSEEGQRASIVQQELLTLPEHLGLLWIRVAQI